MTRRVCARARLGYAVPSLVALAAAPSHATPDALHGSGTRAGSLARANGADLDDAAAVLENPSGLVRAPGTMVSLGYERQANDLRYDGRDALLPTVHSYALGIAVPGAIHRIPVALGLSLALPDGRLSNLRQVEPADPYFPLDDAVPRLVDLATALAVRPLDELSLGAGVGFVSSLAGAFRVRGTAVAADGRGAEYDSELSHAVDADLLSSRYPILGLGFTPFDALSLGISYRGAVRVRQRVEGQLEGTLAISDLRVPVVYDFASDAVVAYSPPELTSAGTVRPLSGLALHGALARQRYSLHPSPYSRRTSRLRADLPPALGLPPDELGTPPPPAGFHDRVVPRVGVEQSFRIGPAVRLAARTGYAYEASPVPSSQEATHLLDMSRHVFGFGAGIAWPRPLPPFAELRLDLGLELVHGIPRSLESRGPRGTTPHRVRGDLLSLGATLGAFFGAGDEPRPRASRR
jgi:long-subunit fatty acid transport protein